MDAQGVVMCGKAQMRLKNMEEAAVSIAGISQPDHVLLARCMWLRGHIQKKLQVYIFLCCWAWTSVCDKIFVDSQDTAALSDNKPRSLGAVLALGSLRKYLKSRKLKKHMVLQGFLASRWSLSWTVLGLSCPKSLKHLWFLKVFGFKTWNKTRKRYRELPHPSNSNHDTGFAKTPRKYVEQDTQQEYLESKNP